MVSKDVLEISRDRIRITTHGGTGKRNEKQNERSSFCSRCRGNTSHINVSFGAVEIAGVRWGNDIKLARSNYRPIENRDKPAKNSIFPYDISTLFTRCLSR